MTAATTDEWVTVDGDRLHYLRSGNSGPPVVLLHGGIIDAAHLTWGSAIEPLGQNARVYALDLLGYGRSDRPEVSYATTMHVETVAGFIEAVGLETAHIVGASLGGGIGLGVALDHPDRVGRLIGVDAFGLGRGLPRGLFTYIVAQLPVLNKLSLALLRRSRGLTEASLEGLVADPDVISGDLVDAVYEQLQERGVGKPFRRWRRHEVTPRGYRTVYRDRLTDLTVPTLLLHGAEDDLFPVEWAESAAESSPAVDLEVFEGCGHWLPRERSDACVSAIKRFLHGNG